MVHSTAKSVDRSNLIQLTPETSRKKELKLSLLNIRSVRQKTSAVIDIVNDFQLDMFAITETWLQQNGDGVLLTELTPHDFQFLHMPRASRGGGVGFLFRKSLNFGKISTFAYSSFECLEIFSKPANLRVVVLYRPPSLSVSLFLDEFADYIQLLNTACGNLIIVGDFNLHMDCSEAATIKKFTSLLHSGNLCQHVHTSTHKEGHILDLVISRSTENVVNDIIISEPCVSDHLLVSCIVTNSLQTGTKHPSITFRRTSDINQDDFRQDLRDSSVCKSTQFSFSLSNLLEIYNLTESLLDKHAPVAEKILKPRKKSEPWFGPDIVNAKKVRRQCERRWHKSGLTVHKDLFIEQSKIVRNKISLSRKNYYAGRIAGATNPKEFFQTVDFLSGRSTPVILPDHSCDIELSERFSHYFQKKIVDICTAINAQCLHLSLPNYSSVSFGTPMHSFSMISDDDICKIVMNSPSKSCKLDPLPTWLVKACIPELVPIITKIVNLSMSMGNFPDTCKVAHVTPVLKKSTLNKDCLKNYRPVSNLSFIAKVIEKVVLSQLMDHLLSENLLEPYQSAYKPGHSTETALLDIHNFIASQLDEGRFVLLVLLDLSSAFDTVSHNNLLNILQSKYRISGTVLTWFKSYLTDRYQQVKIGNFLSSVKHLDTGVPQGSVLGPVLFSMYLSGLSDVIRHHGIHFHHYADDTQLYISFDKNNIQASFQAMEACISDVNKWLTIHQLKLNCDKTECIVFRSKFLSANPDFPPLAVGDDLIYASNNVRNLGAYFDQNLTMDKHVDTFCRSANWQLRNISLLRKYLDDKTCEMLVHAFVTSRLDFHNSLLYGLSHLSIMKLQKIQNSAARIVKRKRRRCHTTPLLKELHWLPISERIKFKILLLTFRAQYLEQPVYISQLLSNYVPPRGLRSSGKGLLSLPKPRLKSYGYRCFAYAAPYLWNQLPDHIRFCTDLSEFKRNLKTHFFTCSFECI